jgi:hypothetical protein
MGGVLIMAGACLDCGLLEPLTNVFGAPFLAVSVGVVLVMA